MPDVRYTNNSGYSLSIAVWLMDDEYDHNPVDGPYISVTELLKPMRMLVLGRRKKLQKDNGVIEEIDIDRFVASRMGTAMHSAIEHSWTRRNGAKEVFKYNLVKLGYKRELVDRIVINPDPEWVKKHPEVIPVYMEQRAYKKVNGITVGGKLDFVGNGFLEDFKSMQVYGAMKDDSNEAFKRQGSLYRWLNPDIITQDRMKIQRIFTDWSKLHAMIQKAKGYPQKRIDNIYIPLYSLDESQRWVEDRLNTLERLMTAPEEELPRCTPEELWQTPTLYKYFGKKENKKASKVFEEDADAAYKYLRDKGKGEIREVPGEVKRCNYCSAMNDCVQCAEYLQSGLLQKL